MASKKLLDCQRSSMKCRKAICSSLGLGTVLLLALSLVVLCFTFVDMGTFYDTSVSSSGSTTGSGDFILQRDNVLAITGSASSFTDVTQVSLDDEDTSAAEPATDSSKPAVEEESVDITDSDYSKELVHKAQSESQAESQPEEPQSESQPEESQNESQAESQSESQGEVQSESEAEFQAQEESSQGETQAEILAMPGNNRSTVAGCDLFHGQWEYDATYPLYRSRNCPFVDTSFRCEENGRPDKDFMKYRWRPHDCDLPRFEARDMLERLRDQRLVFVGDSLGRNQWESMLCMLSEAVHNKSRIQEVGGRSISKHMGELVFLFLDYNCTVEYFRDPFLVPQVRPPPGLPKNVTSVLRIDQVSWSAKRWRGASILVFNSGHWWSWEKIGRPGGRFFMKDHLTEHSNEDAFKTGLETWALWMEHNLDPSTQVFFRSFASVHFRGGAWNHGGHCHEEVKPLTDEEVEREQPIPWTNKHIKAAISKNIKAKRSAVEYMDVTTLTNYRADGHAGLYGMDTKIHGLPPKNRQDCSHFCLPGVPDTWNELLYASLLARGQGVWGEPIRY